MRTRLAFLAFSLVLLSCTVAAADDWPRWLGEKGDSVWREDGIVDTFPATGLKTLWTTNIGGGFGGPAVADGRVFVADWLPMQADGKLAASGVITEDTKADPWKKTSRSGKERVLALDAKTGKILWKFEYDCPYTTAKNYATGPRTTPTVDGDRVYSLGTEGNLVCLEAATGKCLWQKDFKKEYGLKTAIWGWSCHPLVDGDKLICIAGGKGTSVVAYDKKTGKTLWTALSSSEPGYSTPSIYEVAGKKVLFAWLDKTINMLDPETGKKYWSLPTKAQFAMSIITPRVYGDQLYLAAAGKEGFMLKLGPELTDVEVVWDTSKSKGAFCPMSTPLLYEGNYYSDSETGAYFCFDAKTGKQKWQTFDVLGIKRPRKYGNTFTVLHDPPSGKRKLVLITEAGELVFAKLTDKGYEEISRTKIIEPTTPIWGRKVVWVHPAFANKTIYFRNDKEIVAVSLEKK